MTPEQRYRLELAKDKTPSTDHFAMLLWPVMIICIAVMVYQPALPTMGFYPDSFHGNQRTETHQRADIHNDGDIFATIEAVGKIGFSIAGGIVR